MNLQGFLDPKDHRFRDEILDFMQILGTFQYDLRPKEPITGFSLKYINCTITFYVNSMALLHLNFMEFTMGEVHVYDKEYTLPGMTNDI